MLTADRARQLIDTFANQRLLVVGDVMLDQFVVGRVERISPEAPVPVVTFDRDEYRLGGAANVAHNLRALGASVDLAGVIGEDEAGSRFVGELEAHGIGTNAILTAAERQTTRKLRIVTTRNQQVARIDYESDTEVSGEIEARLVAAIQGAAASARAIVVSDYLKGAVTRCIVEDIVASARARGIAVLIDPKIPHLTYYAGATLVTPNHQEAEIATHRRIRTDVHAEDAARVFRDHVRCEAVLITRGEQGMSLLDRTGASDGDAVHHLPAVAREVADVTGAGDTVIATLGIALAAGASVVESAFLANVAAGIVVGKFGPATVSVEELFREWRY